MLKNVSFQETDTFGEVNIVLNKLIDNLNLVESKVLVLDKTTAKKSWVKSWVRGLLKPKKENNKTRKEANNV